MGGDSQLISQAELTASIQTLGGDKQGTYTPGGPDPEPVTFYVVFEDAYKGAGGDGFTATAAPQAGCATKEILDAGGTIENATIVIDSVTYQVLDHQPDGTGYSILPLAVNK